MTISNYNMTINHNICNIKTIITIILTVFIIFSAIEPVMSDTEEPKYNIKLIEDNIEIRLYEPMIIAEVDIKGNRDSAASQGFKILADYIFGNNNINQDIAMTAPVQQQNNQKINMTAPVQQQESNDVWKISFVMPSQYSMKTLPKPNNPKITIKEIPEKAYIAIRFSGMRSDYNMTKHKKQLMQYVTDHNIKIIAAPKYAFYDPPWTLPFLRRNEIMMEIQN